MRVKQVIIPLILVLILVVFNKIFLNTFNKANDYFSNQYLYNSEVIDSQKLFERIWKVIAKE